MDDADDGGEAAHGGDRPVRVVLVEDEDLYRDLVRGCLEQEVGLQVVGSFGDGASAMAVAPALRPDVALLDIRLPGGPDGIRVGLELRKRLPHLGVVVLSHHADPRLAATLAGSTGRAGVVAGWSYLLKTSVRERTVLVRAVLGAARGEVVVDPRVVAGGRPRVGSLLASLTPRQREIISLVAEGCSNGAIAQRLVLAEKSVENQLTTIYEHLALDRGDGAAHRRVQAVLAYLRESQWPSDAPDAVAPREQMGDTPLEPAPRQGYGRGMAHTSAPRPRTVSRFPVATAPGDPGAEGARGRRLGVFLVDDQPTFLAAVRTLLGASPQLTIVGEATSGTEALARLPGLSADVVLLDVQMPGLNGFETAQALRTLVPGLRIVLTSALDDRAYAATAARLGAAFLPKRQLSPAALLGLVRDGGGAPD